MKDYEVTFIVDPVLSGDEIRSTAKTYIDMIGSDGRTTTHVDEMGLRQLAYPIKNRTTGIYYCVEFQTPTGAFISEIELAFRRDERIMRFLSVSLNKYGVKYNDDKRNGKIGKVKPKVKAKPSDNRRGNNRNSSRPQSKPVAKPAPVAKAAPAPAPVAVAVSEEEE